MTRVTGLCPMGCGETLLFLTFTGLIACKHEACPDPDAASKILALDDQHRVEFREHDFIVEHPLRERIEGTMGLCVMHGWLSRLDGPPVPPGRYVAVPHVRDHEGNPAPWRFELEE